MPERDEDNKISANASENANGTKLMWAIIFGSMVIGGSIYFGLTLEYRTYMQACLEGYPTEDSLEEQTFNCVSWYRGK